MKIGVYSIRDIKSGYLTPTFEVNDQVAYRGFELAKSDSNTVFGFRPVDFELFKIAVFDTDTGEFTDIERKCITNEYSN